MEIKKEVCQGVEEWRREAEEVRNGGGTLAFGSAVHGRVSYRNTASVAFWMTGKKKGGLTFEEKGEKQGEERGR